VAGRERANVGMSGATRFASGGRRRKEAGVVFSFTEHVCKTSIVVSSAPDFSHRCMQARQQNMELGAPPAVLQTSHGASVASATHVTDETCRGVASRQARRARPTSKVAGVAGLVRRGGAERPLLAWSPADVLIPACAAAGMVRFEMWDVAHLLKPEGSGRWGRKGGGGAAAML